MTSRSFRRLFPQLNVQSVPEDEFYRQAVLSQLLTGPDEQELSSFRPDVKDPLELVEATPELAGMLGSSLEFVDSHWDSLEGSPPPSPPPPPSPRLSPRPPQRIPPLLVQQGSTEAAAKVHSVLQNRTVESGQCQGPKNMGYSSSAPKMEAKLDVSMWEPPQKESKNVGIPSPANPSITHSSVWEVQRQQSKNAGITNSANPDSSMWDVQRLQSMNAGIPNSTHLDSNMDTNLWEQKVQQSKDSGMANSPNVDSKVKSNTWEPQRQQSKTTWITNSANGDFKIDSKMWEPQRQQCRNTGMTNCANPDSKTDTSMWEQKQQHSKDTGTNSANLDSKMDSITWEPQRQPSTNTGITGSANGDSKMGSSVWEQPRHRSKTTTVKPSNAAVGASMWEPQRLRNRNPVNADIKVDDSLSEPQRLRNKNNGNSSLMNLNGAVDSYMWKRQNQGSKTGGGSTHQGASVAGSIWEPQRLRSKNAAIMSPAKPDARMNANTQESQVIKSSTAPKREANSCDTQGGKNIKVDTAWNRNLGNVRVHVRDVGVKGTGGAVRRDVKKDQGKGARVKTRS